ncbi:NAD(P)/FAD-dependent oxidoreductase [Rhizobacter sp. Root1221]|uniref:NAD(P)/FAD-dependent oxidoreductase n=1 Tax=Rhizobacter sp. Root1221 TaxID=1736433 RepID=UPI0006F601AF|nr:FAD-dependent oxidoreductase [Rhizobacter sp. Root1221]KQV99759.1 pyridine nucleotide-disulfide oxidoreductase [Rhizobacter sp. Root1221]
MSASVVILGTGLAGFTLAREFRKLDKDTPLVLVSRDHGGFYSKPMLSNALAGNKTAASLVMKDSDKMVAELNATIHNRATVSRIDTAARTVELADGTRIGYRDLVFAVGADPIRLPLEGDAADTVLSVNDLDDYATFAGRLDGVTSVAILGAGLIGCEFANDLLSRGIVPTVIDLAPRVLPRLLPEAASERLRAKLAEAGAQFRFGVSAVRVDRVGDAGNGLRVTLSDGQALDAGLVLSAIGLRPRTTLAAEAGLQVNRGIVTNRLLAASAGHVHALGDCAEVDGHTLPYVMPIMQQARALAATLAGNPTPVVYPAMPVIVKTPACPTVVCPPPLDASGAWTVELTDDGCDARFHRGDGQLLGFALLGAATKQRQALATQVPGLLV